MRSRTLLALTFAVFMVAVPLAVHAQGIPFFGPIVPQTGNQAVCPASWGMVIIIINRLIAFLLTLTIVFVAPLMIAWSGFLFVVNPVNASGKEQAKKILLNTVVGIVIALCGWLIVDAIMVVLYNGKFGTWSTLISSGGIDPCLSQKGALPGAGLTPAAPPAPGVSVVPPAANCAASYASILPGITVSSSGNCCDKAQSTCTSLDGMSPSTVQQIINIQQACGSVVVTGGTEVGHASEGGAGSHSSGAKVDIGANIISCVLRNGGTTISPPSFGSSQARGRCGDIYTWEGNHTDVYVVSTCTL